MADQETTASLTADQVREHLTETIWLVVEAFGGDRNCAGCQKVVRHMDRREYGSICAFHFWRKK